MIVLELTDGKRIVDVSFDTDEMSDKDEPTFSSRDVWFPWREGVGLTGHMALNGLVSPEDFIHIAGMFGLDCRVKYIKPTPYPEVSVDEFKSDINRALSLTLQEGENKLIAFHLGDLIGSVLLTDAKNQEELNTFYKRLCEGLHQGIGLSDETENTRESVNSYLYPKK